MCLFFQFEWNDNVLKLEENSNLSSEEEEKKRRKKFKFKLISFSLSTIVAAISTPPSYRVLSFELRWGGQKDECF